MSAELLIRFTNDYEAACRLRDLGFEPIECAFGQYGSVMGPLDMDHHGKESHREGVALRACRDLYGARRDDPRFVVTGTPDADAVLAIVALAGLCEPERLRPDFYQLVDAHDTDPIGHDLLATSEGEVLAHFNQQPGLFQNEGGFYTAVKLMRALLETGLEDGQRDQIRRADANRRRTALEGILAVVHRDGRRGEPPESATGLVLRRGDEATSDSARVLVVKSPVWGFDQWYRMAPVVVSYASRMAKVTVGCPDGPTARRLFGDDGLMTAWRTLGKGWGGRPTIGGSPRGTRMRVSDAYQTAETLLNLLLE